MFTLFCNLTCSYQKTKVYTLQLFMNILWCASADLHAKKNNPSIVYLNSINFPPKMLYYNMNKKHYGLFFR